MYHCSCPATANDHSPQWSCCPQNLNHYANVIKSEASLSFPSLSPRNVSEYFFLSGGKDEESSDPGYANDEAYR
ncbi:hypothetical protein HAX54_050075 [Datura stramonium]|uniref:Uncharacterized protein n=1 Tax=Datura stramonium TaxID=4076 RepID=A0ABS8RQU7_DATST|nr:hypothetical protein [Datura stramonium]